MQRPSKKAVLSLILLVVVSSACVGTATPTQVSVQATISPVGSTAQLQVPESTGTPELPVILQTDTPAIPTASLPPLEITTTSALVLKERVDSIL
jgi:hypothetical protein